MSWRFTCKGMCENACSSDCKHRELHQRVVEDLDEFRRLGIPDHGGCTCYLQEIPQLPQIPINKLWKLTHRAASEGQVESAVVLAPSEKEARWLMKAYDTQQGWLNPVDSSCELVIMFSSPRVLLADTIGEL